MAKIVLGQRPKSFKKVVKFPMLDGSQGSIECEFKYRTQKEFNGLFSEVFGMTTEDAEKLTPEVLVARMNANVLQQAHFVGAALLGWNLDEPLTPDNVLQLCDELPGAAQAIMDTYRQAVRDGKLGN